MGPGGLRGLQILRSGAFRVRGGFDSHAFPPLFRALLVVVGLVAMGASVRPGWAARAEAGFVAPESNLDASAWASTSSSSGRAGAVASGSTSTDTVTVETEAESRASAPDTSRARVKPAGTTARASRYDAPRWVMLRSAVFPGWGQAHNGSWIKAGAVVAGEGSLVWRLFDDKRVLDRLSDEIAATQAAGDDELEATLVDRYNARLDAYTGRQWFLGAVFVYSLLDAYIDAHFRSFKTEFQADPALPEGVPPASEMRFGLRMSF